MRHGPFACVHTHRPAPRRPLRVSFSKTLRVSLPSDPRRGARLGPVLGSALSHRSQPFASRGNLTAPEFDEWTDRSASNQTARRALRSGAVSPSPGECALLAGRSSPLQPNSTGPPRDPSPPPNSLALHGRSAQARAEAKPHRSLETAALHREPNLVSGPRNPISLAAARSGPAG